MNTVARLSAYGVAPALFTGGACATGSAVGPLAPTAPAATGAARPGMAGAEGAGHGDTHSGAVAKTADQPAGLASSRGGYTLTPTASRLTAGEATDFRHDDVVRTAPFAVPAGATTAIPLAASWPAGYAHEHGTQNGDR